MHVNHMSKRRASRAKRGEWCMTMLRKMFTRCPNRLPMLAHARICLHQLASVCTRLPTFINARTCLPMLACDCTRFAFICPRLPMPVNAWTCYPALDKLIILNALPVHAKTGSQKPCFCLRGPHFLDPLKFSKIEAQGDLILDRF